MAAGFCSRCGTSLTIGSQYCAKCGAAVSGSSTPTPAPPAFQTPGIQAPSPPLGISAAVPRKSRLPIYAIVAIVAIVVVIAAVFLFSAYRPGNTTASGSNNGNTNPPPGPVNTPPAPITVVASGTVWPLSAGQYEYAEFSTAASGTLTGSFTATAGVTGYVMNPAEYAAYSSSGSASSYLYTTGHVSSGTLNTNLAAGTYYLVFANTNLITSTSVDWTTGCVASF